MAAAHTARDNAVSVVLRVRPPLQSEAYDEHCLRVNARRVQLTLEASTPSARTRHISADGNVPPPRKAGASGKSVRRVVDCEYDQVLDMTASQDIVWDTVRPKVELAFEGDNATIFTYGMTGSGKTYTMLGPKLMDMAYLDARMPTYREVNQCRQCGLVPRVVQMIFERLASEQAQGRKGNKVTISYVQIYQERCYDLLVPAAAAKPLRLHEDSGSISNSMATPRRRSKPLAALPALVIAEGLIEAPVGSAEACFQRIATGLSNMTFRATAYNEQSSRSHSILTFVLHRQDPGTGVMRKSRVQLVDLAGNERWDSMHTSLSYSHARELTSINKSLHVLGACIQALAKASTTSATSGHKRALAPYRDSSLTMLLRDSLAGGAFVVLLCTICGSANYQMQSLGTLRFADRAKRIKLQVLRREAMGQTEVLQHSQEELAYLRALVAKAGAGQDIKGHIDEVQRRNVELETENQGLRRQLAGLIARSKQAQLSTTHVGGAFEARQAPFTSVVGGGDGGGFASSTFAGKAPLRRTMSAPALFHLAFEAMDLDAIDLGAEKASGGLEPRMTHPGSGGHAQYRARSAQAPAFLSAAPLRPFRPPPLNPMDSPQEEPAHTVSAETSARPDSRSTVYSVTPLTSPRCCDDNISPSSLLARELQRAADQHEISARRLLERQAWPDRVAAVATAACANLAVSCPGGHQLVPLGSVEKPSKGPVAAYAEWHCDSDGCQCGSLLSPATSRFHCSICQYDLCEACHDAAALTLAPRWKVAPFALETGPTLVAAEQVCTDGFGLASVSSGRSYNVGLVTSLSAGSSSSVRTHAPGETVAGGMLVPEPVSSGQLHSQRVRSSGSQPPCDPGISLPSLDHGGHTEASRQMTAPHGPHSSGAPLFTAARPPKRPDAALFPGSSVYAIPLSARHRRSSHSAKRRGCPPLMAASLTNASEPRLPCSDRRSERRFRSFSPSCPLPPWSDDGRSTSNTSALSLHRANSNSSTAPGTPELRAAKLLSGTDAVLPTPCDTEKEDMALPEVPSKRPLDRDIGECSRGQCEMFGPMEAVECLCNLDATSLSDLKSVTEVHNCPEHIQPQMSILQTSLAPRIQQPSPPLGRSLVGVSPVACGSPRTALGSDQQSSGPFKPLTPRKCSPSPLRQSFVGHSLPPLGLGGGGKSVDSVPDTQDSVGQTTNAAARRLVAIHQRFGLGTRPPSAASTCSLPRSSPEEAMTMGELLGALDKERRRHEAAESVSAAL